jgi:hypothetical protein
MKYQLIPLIASLLLGASSFLLGMSLEDTQGRTLEATDVSVAGQSVTFTRADTGQVFTVPVDTFSNKTLEKISKIEQVEPLQDSTPVPEIGINILDNEGRTINATDFKVEGDSVSFTMVKTEREFTIALSTLSDKSQKEIKELIERNTQEESFQAILPDPESTQGYQPTEDIRVLDVTKNEIVYEIPERIQTRQGKPIDIIKASEISTLYRDYQGEVPESVRLKIPEIEQTTGFSLDTCFRILYEYHFSYSMDHATAVSLTRRVATPAVLSDIMMAAETFNSFAFTANAEIWHPDEAGFEEQWLGIQEELLEGRPVYASFMPETLDDTLSAALLYGFEADQILLFSPANGRKKIDVEKLKEQTHGFVRVAPRQPVRFTEKEFLKVQSVFHEEERFKTAFIKLSDVADCRLRVIYPMGRPNDRTVIDNFLDESGASLLRSLLVQNRAVIIPAYSRSGISEAYLLTDIDGERFIGSRLRSGTWSQVADFSAKSIYTDWKVAAPYTDSLYYLDVILWPQGSHN